MGLHSFLLAFWGFISFVFGLLGFISFHFGRFGASFPLFLAFWGFISAFISFHFSLLGFHFLSFWPFGPSFPFILAFWAFVSFHFGLFGVHFLTIWPFGLSFPFILAFWAFISFHLGLLELEGGHPPHLGGILHILGGILVFWGVQGGILYIFGALPVGSPHKLRKTAHFLEVFKWGLTAPGLGSFFVFFGLHPGGYPPHLGGILIPGVSSSSGGVSSTSWGASSSSCGVSSSSGGYPLVSSKFWAASSTSVGGHPSSSWGVSSLILGVSFLHFVALKPGLGQDLTWPFCLLFVGRLSFSSCEALCLVYTRRSEAVTALPAMGIRARGYRCPGRPAPPAVGRCCRGVPSRGPRLTQGEVVCRPSTD